MSNRRPGLTTGLRLATSSIALLIAFFAPPTSLYSETNPARRIKPSEEIRFERISVDQGLPSHVCRAILKDRRGFVWVGSDNGLYRYDGYAFKAYNMTPGRRTTTAEVVISGLLEDRNGVIWIATAGGGLKSLDPRTDSLTTYLHDKQDPTSLAHNDVYGLFEDHAGRLWVGTADGLDRLDRVTQNFSHIGYSSAGNDSLGGKTIRVIFESKTDPGIYWIGSWGSGLYRFYESKNVWAHFTPDSLDRSTIGGRFVRCIVPSRVHQGSFWIGTSDGGVSLFSLASNTCRRFRHDPASSVGLSGNNVRALFEDSSGTVWIALDGAGINRFDTKRDRVLWYRHLPDNTNTLPSDGVFDLFEDETGLMWVATAEGICKSSVNRGAYIHYEHDPEVPDGMPDAYVASLIEDRSGRILLGTRRGVFTFDPASETFSYLGGPAAGSHDARDTVVRTIYEDRSGKLWVGTPKGNLYTLHYMTGVCTPFASVPGLPKGDKSAISALFDDGAGSFWVGTGSGLYALDRAKRTLCSIPISTRDHPEPFSPDIGFISRDRTGTIWMGSWRSGLFSYSPETKAFTAHQYIPGDSSSLGAQHVSDMYEDRQGTLWFATGGGLSRFDRAQGTFKTFTEVDGLPANDISWVMGDRSGYLWLGTANGIARFNPVEGVARIYSTTLVAPIGYLGLCHLHGHDGTMYSSGNYGINIFHPEKARLVDHIPPVYIVSFKIFDHEVHTDRPITMLDAMSISHSDNYFSFEFSALGLHNPRQNKYAYELEGFDNNWILSGNRHYAAYTNVPPGEYVFRVKGSNSDGVWNEKGTALRIVITPPLWKTWWAYAAYAVLGAALLYSLYRLRLNRVRLRYRLAMERLESEKMREVDRMKSRFFANISHEFRTPLTLVLGPLENLLTEMKDEKVRQRLRVIKRNAQKLLGLINQLLDLSKLEAGGMKVRSRQLNIVPIVRGIAFSFESSAGLRKIDLSVSAEEDDIEVYVDTGMLEKILVNLLSNALKFTPEGGEVAVTLTAVYRLPDGPHHGGQASPDERGVSGGRGEGVVEIEVSDTGIGIPPDQLDKVFDRFYQIDASQTREQEGSGIGLALVKELVEIHHGTIQVESEVGRGTTFTVRLPLGKAHLTNEEIGSEIDGATTQKPDLDMGLSLSPQSPVPALESKLPNQNSARLTSRPVILIVEDNADVRLYIRDNLPGIYQILEAEDGAEGVKVAQETIPDLIISDVMMPKKDGYELCRILKMDERTSHIPIILLTAKAASENRIEGLETGADDYLVKPFEPRELAARVSNLIELRRKLRDRFGKRIPLEPGEIAVTSVDDRFFRKVMVAVDQHMGEEAFNVEALSHDVGMSRRQLHRKLIALTGLPASDFIRYLRLCRAMEMLKGNAGSVSEIAYRVGFGDPFHFSKTFHKQFGMAPSEVRSRLERGLDSSGMPVETLADQ